MIVYSDTKKNFQRDIANGVIAERLDRLFTGLGITRESKAEFNSWKASLPQMGMIVSDRRIDDSVRVALEYRIPLTSKRVDFMVAGNNGISDNVVIVELKQWESCEATSRDNVVKAFIGGAVREVAHPSQQAYSYAKLIENFNEDVRANSISLIPCAYLHNYKEEARQHICHKKYNEVIKEAPLFLKEDGTKLTDYIVRFAPKPSIKELFEIIENGKLKPSKALQDAVGSILNGNDEFTMIDEQQVAYATILKLVENTIEDSTKHVIIVQGGPGTGKSVIAINLLAARATFFAALYQKYLLSFDAFRNAFLDEDTGVYSYLSQHYQHGNEELNKALQDSSISDEIKKDLAIYLRKIHIEKTKQKAKEIQEYFIENYIDDKKNPFLLDDEQAYAVAVDSKYVLVSARAGSGKTRVIASKILYLIGKENVKESEIVSLSFNRNVKGEVSERINEGILFKGLNYEPRTMDIAKTFHSLAYSCVPHVQVLSDEPNNMRSYFVRDILEKMKKENPEFKKQVYNFFRSESFKVDRKQFKNEDDYYIWLRNSSFQTLKNEKVKSIGEKWIADFLYEHGINYIYEHSFYPFYLKKENLKCNEENAQKIEKFLDKNCRKSEDGRTVRKAIKPDFYLQDYNYVWEHWGIDESRDTIEQKNAFNSAFDESWEEYKEKMLWKKTFWSVKWERYATKSKRQIEEICKIKKLLETNISEVSLGREAFEKRLLELMQENNITVKEPDYDDLIKDVWDRQITKFTKMMVQFIDKFEQTFPKESPKVLFDLAYEMNLNPNVCAFIEIGVSVLNEYNRILSAEQKPKGFEKYSNFTCDFNQLLAEATEIISSGQKDDIPNSLKYILVDEYQDFSELFYRFISSLLNRNPDINLFCVGDNWQAINGFMGADTIYFDNFTDYFHGAENVSIANNYRSCSNLVYKSNGIMNYLGFSEIPAKAHNLSNAKIICKDIKDVFVERRKDPEHIETTNKDLKYKSILNPNSENPLETNYMKYVIEIITSELKKKQQSVLILARTNRFLDYDLGFVEKKIKEYLRKEEKFSRYYADLISVKTIHKAKGDEADIVFLLSANNDEIPFLHPDNVLYEVFGTTAEKVLKEESCLFYVATTRAKKSFYLLYDGDCSEYAMKYISIEEKPYIG